MTQEELKKFLKEHLKIELYTHRECYKDYLKEDGLIPMGLSLDATNLNIY